MSEDYGKCPRCKGKGTVICMTDAEPRTSYAVDCLSCDGTGRAKDAISYLQQQADSDWQRDRPYLGRGWKE